MDFPIGIFPPIIQQIIYELYNNNQFPIDYSSCAVLSAISTGIGNTMRIRVKHGFDQPAHLFLAFVGSPGINKSAPINFFFRRFYVKDDEEIKSYRSAKKVYNQKLKKNEQSKDIINDPEPIRSQTMVNDTTIEGIISLHHGNPKGLCLHADELMGWINSYGRYNKGSDEQTWLTIFSGGPIRITRKNADLDISIPNTCINVIGTIQPDVLPKLINADKLYNGFVDRILFAFPANTKSLRWTDNDADITVLAKWDDIIGKLISLEYTPEKEPTIIFFSTDAKKHLRQWQNKIAENDDKNQNDTIRGLHAKLETYVIRFCLILHVLDCICNKKDISTEVPESIVVNSIKLFDYFEDTAKRARAVSAINSLSKPIESIYDSLPNTFTTSYALEFSSVYRISERTIQRFLTENIGILFIKTSRGHYKKIVI